MHRLKGASSIIILLIAFYFVVVCGFEAIQMLASSTFGLDDVWRSQFVFAIGRFFSLSPTALIKLAAFFATIKLVAAIACLGYIVARIRAWPEKTDPDVFEAALILIVILNLLAVGPAVWSQQVSLVRQHTIELVLAGLAVALCLVGRRAGQQPGAEFNLLKYPVWFTPWR